MKSLRKGLKGVAEYLNELESGLALGKSKRKLRKIGKDISAALRELSSHEVGIVLDDLKDYSEYLPRSVRKSYRLN